MPRLAPPDRFRTLVSAATRVFIAQGYRRTQMADVADALGVAKGTLYLTVESKEALFDAAVRLADAAPEEVVPFGPLPLPTPPPGATLREVEKVVANEGVPPALAAALEGKRPRRGRTELEAILRELYAMLSRHRVGIKLIDRCASDYPELAGVWYRVARGSVVDALTRFLEVRARRGRLRRWPEPAVAARIVLETETYWAVHRHWDGSPRRIDDAVAEDTVIAFLVAALWQE